jgi:small subunit ribosomal protein S11
VVAERGGRGRADTLEAPFDGRHEEIRSIKDVTPIPHNGCRPPKRRRV